MKKILLSLGMVSIVGVASAQQVLSNVDNIINKLKEIVSGGVAGLLMSLVFVVFLLSIITFIWKRRSGDDKGMNDAKNMLGWSVIAMFVMVAIWGLVVFLSQTFGVGLGGNVYKPATLPVEKTTGGNPGASNLKPSGASCQNSNECQSGVCEDPLGAFVGTCK
jgi:hypothetical protein